jgi:ABC-type nitrate/sulfonate/bicarbonate transport system permease component
MASGAKLGKLGATGFGDREHLYRRTGTGDRASAKRAGMRLVPAIVFALLVLGLWQLYVSASGISETSLPEPTRIASAAWHIRSLLISNGWTTLQEVLLGFLLGAAVGVLLAIMVGTSKLASRALYPWLVISQTVPIVAIAPIIVIWTGFDIRPKLIVVALVTFFPVTVNMADGLRSTEPELLDLLRTLGAGRWQRFRTAQLPASLPFLFSGLKVAAVFCTVGAVFAEWVGSSSGLGYLILTYNQQTATTDMFATIVALSVIGIIMFALVSTAQRVALPWYHQTRELNT